MWALYGCESLVGKPRGGARSESPRVGVHMVAGRSAGEDVRGTAARDQLLGLCGGGGAADVEALEVLAGDGVEVGALFSGFDSLRDGLQGLPGSTLRTTPYPIASWTHRSPPRQSRAVQLRSAWRRSHSSRTSGGH